MEFRFVSRMSDGATLSGGIQKGSRSLVIETITEPDLIQAGDSGELLAVRLYEVNQLGRKYVVVAYREINATNGFILTAYLTHRPSQQREILWTR